MGSDRGHINRTWIEDREKRIRIEVLDIKLRQRTGLRGLGHCTRIEVSDRRLRHRTLIEELNRVLGKQTQTRSWAEDTDRGL